MVRKYVLRQGKVRGKGLAFVLLVAVSFWVFSGLWADTEIVEDSSISVPTTSYPTVRVETLESQSITKDISLSGVTDVPRVVEIKAHRSGHIDSLTRVEGGYVEEGGVIATIAMEDRQARLAEAKALLKQRQLEYRVAKSLSKRGHQSETKLAQSYTDLKAAQAQLQAMEVDIAYTKITAPFSGVIDAYHVEIGDVVKAQDSNIATFMDTSHLVLKAYVPQNHIRHVHEGLQVRAALATGENVSGEVTRISRFADDNTRTFTVEIHVPVEQGAYVEAGVTAQIVIPLFETHAHFVLQSYLALNNAGDIGIKTLDEQNITHFHPVDIIKDTPDGLWVKGLPPIANVITLGHPFVQEGDQAIILNGVR